MSFTKEVRTHKTKRELVYTSAACHSQASISWDLSLSGTVCTEDIVSAIFISCAFALSGKVLSYVCRSLVLVRSFFALCYFCISPDEGSQISQAIWLFMISHCINSSRNLSLNSISAPLLCFCRTALRVLFFQTKRKLCPIWESSSVNNK
jgi:Na+/proline symporter